MSDEEVRKKQELRDVIVSRLHKLSPLVAETLKTVGAAEPKGELDTHFYEEGDWCLYENNNHDERILEFMAYQVAVKLQSDRVFFNKKRIIIGGLLGCLFGLIGWTGYMASKSEQEQAESEWNSLAFLGGSVALHRLGLVWLHRQTEDNIRTVQLLCRHNKMNVAKRMIELLGHGDEYAQERHDVMQKELEKQGVFNI